jgi:hypothetical protein
MLSKYSAKLIIYALILSTVYLVIAFLIQNRRVIPEKESFENSENGCLRTMVIVDHIPTVKDVVTSRCDDTKRVPFDISENVIDREWTFAAVLKDNAVLFKRSAKSYEGSLFSISTVYTSDTPSPVEWYPLSPNFYVIGVDHSIVDNRYSGSSNSKNYIILREHTIDMYTQDTLNETISLPEGWVVVTDYDPIAKPDTSPYFRTHLSEDTLVVTAQRKDARIVYRLYIWMRLPKTRIWKPVGIVDLPENGLSSNNNLDLSKAGYSVQCRLISQDTTPSRICVSVASAMVLSVYSFTPLVENTVSSHEWGSVQVQGYADTQWTETEPVIADEIYGGHLLSRNGKYIVQGVSFLTNTISAYSTLRVWNIDRNAYGCNRQVVGVASECNSVDRYVFADERVARLPFSSSARWVSENTGLDFSSNFIVPSISHRYEDPVQLRQYSVRHAPLERSNILFERSSTTSRLAHVLELWYSESRFLTETFRDLTSVNDRSRTRFDIDTLTGAFIDVNNASNTSFNLSDYV